MSESRTSEKQSDYKLGAERDPHEQEQDRRLATVRNLLSKAEATEFPEEAEAFFAKASELIGRWAIDEAMLWDGADSGGRELPDELQLNVHGPYLAQKAILIAGVASAHGCRAIRLRGESESGTEIISIIGFPTDLRWVETLVTSLLMQLTSAMLSQCPKGVSASESASWRRSFIVGYAQEVRSRLEKDRAAAAAARATYDPASGDHGDGSDRASGAESSDGSHASASSAGSGNSVSLVLASRAAEVDQDFRQRFPYVRSSWASSGRSATGRNAGRKAGSKASLTRGGIGGRRALGPS
ncbi:MAG TPA: DUF2786 domain-containing protein [Microthrixaceae bacterium]|nr:DUF2786 domain-containing protein [Microthrixaceae bacterium]